MTVKQYDLDEKGKVRQPTRPARPRWTGRPLETAVLSGGCLARLFFLATHVALWGLVILSFIGTFYGIQDADAPITNPIQVFADLERAGWILFGGAIAGQAFLAVAQWGGRQAALEDPRWWVAYIGALLLSVWLNWRAYGDPLIELTGMPWLITLLLIAAGDVVPEWMLVREEQSKAS